MYQKLLILILILNVSTIYGEKTNKEYVDFTAKASIQSTLTKFTITCGSHLNELCKIQSRNYKMYLKLCSVQYLSHSKLISDYKAEFEELIRDTNTKDCGSYDDARIFTELDNDIHFNCGPLFNENGTDSNWDSFSLNREDTFNIYEWNGNLLIVAIITTTENECVDTTILWNIGVIALPSFSYRSSYPPLTMILETVWNPTGTSNHQLYNNTKIYFQNLIHKSKKLQSTFTSKLFIKIAVHCPENYFLNGCWHFCNNVTTRRTCDWNNGSETCAPGWFKSKVLYIDRRGRKRNERRITLEQCNIINKCTNKTCESICIPTGNSTYICAETFLRIDPPFLAVLPGEVIKCYLDYGDYASFGNLTVSWQFDNGVFKQNTMANMIIKEDILQVLPHASYSTNNMVACYATNSAQVNIIKSVKNFTIIKYPTFLKINLTQQNVYLGDCIKPSSDAWPEELFQYNFFVPTNNFPSDSEIDTFNIPKNAKLGKMILNCTCTCTGSKRTDIIFYRVFKLYINVMREFKWSYIKKQYYVDNDYFNVTADVRVNHEIQILQISGPSSVERFSDQNIQFNKGCKGGTYIFLATLYIFTGGKFISFHQSFRETLGSPPSYIKFSKIIGYLGENIYCIVDGYPEELVDIIFTVNNMNGNNLLNSTKRKIKFPIQGIINNSYTISCQYRMVMENVTYSDMVEEYVLMQEPPKPFLMVNQNKSILLVIILLFLLYLLIQFFLTLFLLSRFRIIVYGLLFNYVFKTFILYNRYRKNIRYNEKMTYISDIILDIQKNSRPDEKLKLSTFYSYLKKRYRESFTPGYTTVPSSLRPVAQVQNVPNKRSVVSEKADTAPPEVIPDFTPLDKYYGLGPSLIQMDNSTPK